MKSGPADINSGLELVATFLIQPVISNLLVRLAITSSQHHSNIESKIPINKNVINQLTFKITDQDGKAINIRYILFPLIFSHMRFYRDSRECNLYG